MARIEEKIQKVGKDIIDAVVETQAWKSLVRHGWPDTDTNRSLAIFTNMFLHLHPVKIPKRSTRFSYTWCMGGITFFLFLLLTLTGVFLMFVYVPDVRRAYYDIRDIEEGVFLGRFTRNLHRWAGHGMVFTTWAHMTRVFLTGAYKPPREFNWVIGVVLLVCTLFLSWTGYLLPWDMLALWAVTVGANMARATPFIGHEGPFPEILGATLTNDVRYILLGGTVVGQNTLLRFYVLHCVAIPLIVSFFLMVHFWRVRKDGFSGSL